MHPKYKEADAISGEILNVLRETLEEQGEGMLESVYHFHVFEELKSVEGSIREVFVR